MKIVKFVKNCSFLGFEEKKKFDTKIAETLYSIEFDAYQKTLKNR